MKGTALLKDSEWTLTKTLDYSPLLQNYDHLKTTIQKTIETLRGRNYLMYHPSGYFTTHDNQLFVLNEYLRKSELLTNQLFPETQATRPKRELFDGIGTMIKFLTGNLDAKDGKRYDRAIEKLSKTTNLQSTILEEQTEVLNKTITAFNINIQKLSQNQKTIAQNLQKFILENRSENAKILGTLSTTTILIEATEALQLFIDTFMELETSLTFAQHQQVHLSLIDNNDLLTSLSTIPKYLNKIRSKTLQLPYPIEPSTLHLYETLIKIKVYQIENSFTFIYEIPLVQKSVDYQLINLIPIPAYHENQLFHMIIPTFNTILFSKEHSIPIDYQYCSPISNNRYFCQKENYFPIPNSKLCETQLLSFDSNQTCKPFIFPLSHSKLTKLTKNSWILSSPNEIVCEIQCADIQYHKTLINTQLIQLTPDCSAVINYNDALFTFESSSKTSINLLSTTIGKLKTDTINNSIKINNSLDLSYIDVNLLKNEQLKLGYQKERLEKGDFSVVHSYSLSSIIIVIVFVVITACLLTYVYMKRQTLIDRIVNKLHVMNIPNITVEQPSNLLQCKG